MLSLRKHIYRLNPFHQVPLPHQIRPILHQGSRITKHINPPAGTAQPQWHPSTAGLTPSGADHRSYIRPKPFLHPPGTFTLNMLFISPLKNYEGEIPEIVVFLVNLTSSALVVLANYRREANDNVIIPFAAGCCTIGVIPFNENKSENPKAVIELADITIRTKFAWDILTVKFKLVVCRKGLLY